MHGCILQSVSISQTFFTVFLLRCAARLIDRVLNRRLLVPRGGRVRWPYGWCDAGVPVKCERLNLLSHFLNPLCETQPILVGNLNSVYIGFLVPYIQLDAMEWGIQPVYQKKKERIRKPLSPIWKKNERLIWFRVCIYNTKKYHHFFF